MNQNEESKIRDFLAKNLDLLPTLVSNLTEVRDVLEREEEEFKAIDHPGGPRPVDLVRRTLSRRNLRGLRSFYGLEVIEIEMPLLNTGQPGFQPSADILARCYEDSRLFLIEVKRMAATEREAVTELSAYTHGLNARIWNLTQSDYAWIPISSEWRTTVRAAFANEVIFANRPVLPMLCEVTQSETGAVTSVGLKLISLLQDVDEPTACAQFAWSCFDTLAFELQKEPAEPRALLEFISACAA